MITRPMLAATYRDQLPDFPLLATPKIDGVRALVVNGTLVSRSFRPIPNVTVRESLERLLPEGADGELTCGSLYSTTSVVMSKDAVSDRLVFHWFDWAYDLDATYRDRVANILGAFASMPDADVTVAPLVPRQVNSVRELEIYESMAVDGGYEGVVVRVPDGRYKCGRSTIREGLMIKIKRSEDHEATVVATEELMVNINERQADNFGNAKRSSAKEGLIRSGRLGAIVAATDDGQVFKIGTGFTEMQRRQLWDDRQDLLGMLVRYRCDTARKNLPRCPVFTGFRHPDDLN